ncbi:hypothetical protein O6H91_15G016500 [Diphasiastrum complanatum]|uniref:Uncharacterized protein n=1 Tax=Diphasiastrum complanatum TaxID=34168 RepID=A0ACC2BG03_DIPCM|nr:hypothetical protein O6H91_15G016500 [Diphasiastrum complanatum]
MNNRMDDLRPSVSTALSRSRMPLVQSNAYYSNPNVAVVILVCMGTFILMGFFSIYMKKCASSEAELDASEQINSEIRRQDDGSSQGGLDKSILNSFPVVSYFVVKGLKRDKDAIECAVCLTEFQDNENIRMLPKCGHSFHPDCIDMWLFSHTTCPLCRRSLVSMPEELRSLDIILTEEEAFSESVRPLEENPSRDERVEVRISIDEDFEENNEADGSLGDANRTAGRVGERETAQVLSRNSQSFRKVAQDLERTEKFSLSSVKNPSMVVKLAPDPSCLRRSYSFGGSGRSLRKALGVKREAYPLLQAPAPDSTQSGSRLQHAESCSILTELISRYEAVGGDRNPSSESSGNA